MAANTLPPSAELRQLLDYNPETGLLSWRQRGVQNFDTRFAGKPAFVARNRDGYCHGRITSVSVTAHRLIWAWWHGEWPSPTQFMDHINGDRADNRIDNLRLVSRTENNRNKRLQRNNHSGAHGVQKHTRDNTWNASITIDGKKAYLGSYPNREEAAAARRGAELALNVFHPNHGRSA